MSNITCPEQTPDVTMLVITVGTLVLSLIDVCINGYIGYKKRHFTSQCCTWCSVAYDSESELQDKNKE